MPTKPTGRPVGRPKGDFYTPEIGLRICTLLAAGESTTSVCKRKDMPAYGTVTRWLNSHPEFKADYARAREDRADKMAEEILQIADDGRNDTYIDVKGNVQVDQDVVARSRLRVEARKWLAAKMAPKKYGEKLAIGGDGDLPPVQITTITRRIVDVGSGD